MIKRLIGIGVSLLLAACGGGGSGSSSSGGAAPPPPPPPSRYSVGGTVYGLRGSGLTLQIGQGETVAVSADGLFVFPTTLTDASRYEVKVAAQPTNLVQVCAVQNATGTLAGAAVTNVIVVCTTSTFRVRGTLAGVRGTGLSLHLQPSNATSPQNTQLISPSTDGVFDFPSAIQDGSSYLISVSLQPASPRQECVVANGSGTLHGGDVNSLSVTCTTPTFTVGGTVSGLRGQGLVLTNNGGDNLAITANGAFTFATPLVDFAGFNVQVGTAPTNLKQHCVVINAINHTFGADVTYVRVECSATQQLGSAGDDEAHAAGTDASANLYVAGRTTGSLDGAANGGGWDGFLFKFSPGGELRWRRQLRTPGNDSVEAIAVLGNGDVYVAGYTGGGLEGSNAGGNDAFVAKYDHDGNLQWTRQLGTAASDIAHGLDFLSDGSVYVAGETAGALDGGSPAGNSDLFVAKLDSSGTRLWLRQLGTPAADVAFGISVDANGTAYAAGGTAGNLDGTVNPSGGEQAFIVKYDSLGNKLTTQLICVSGILGCTFRDTSRPPPTHNLNRVNSIKVGLSGESYIAGWVRDDRSGSFGSRYAINARVEPNGVIVWNQLHVVGNDIDMEKTSIALGKADGTFYIVGNQGNAETGAGNALAARIHLSTQPTYFVDEIGSYGRAEARAITSDLASNAYVVGRTFVSLDGNEHLGGSDIFIVRYNDAGERQ